jgi:hypothetical protein
VSYHRSLYNNVYSLHHFQQSDEFERMLNDVAFQPLSFSQAASQNRYSFPKLEEVSIDFNIEPISTDTFDAVKSSIIKTTLLLRGDKEVQARTVIDTILVTAFGAVDDFYFELEPVFEVRHDQSIYVRGPIDYVFYRNVDEELTPIGVIEAKRSRTISYESSQQQLFLEMRSLIQKNSERISQCWGILTDGVVWKYYLANKLYVYKFAQHSYDVDNDDALRNILAILQALVKNFKTIYSSILRNEDVADSEDELYRLRGVESLIDSLTP